jgi:FKBP-type peptidyl-prolyl cis-trans isomerase FkpA
MRLALLLAAFSLHACAVVAPKPPPGPPPLSAGTLIVFEARADASGTGIDPAVVTAEMEKAAVAEAKSLKVIPRAELVKIMQARGVKEPHPDRSGLQAVEALKALGAEYALYGVIDRTETIGAGMLAGIVTSTGDRAAEWMRGKQEELVQDLPRQVGALLQDLGASATPPVKYSNGMVLEILDPGKGPHPRPAERVKVNYEGRLDDGTVFDSSYKRGEPAVFGLDRVIACWSEAIPKLRLGAKAKLTCPPSIAYGDRGQPPSIPPNATLHFSVELLGIEK